MSDNHTPIEALVEPAFGDPPDITMVNRFLGPVRENLIAADASSHRSLRNVVLSMVIFEVLEQSSVTEISVALMRVSDLTIVQKALPLVAAFYCYQMLTALSARRVMMEAYDKAMGLIQFGTRDNDVRRFFHPPSLVGNEYLLSSFAVGTVGKLWHLLGLSAMASIVLGPPLLIVYAIARNFGEFGLSDGFVVALSLLSFVLLLKGLLAISVVQRVLNVPDIAEPDERERFF